MRTNRKALLLLAVVSLSFANMQSSFAATQPWLTWQRNPLTIPLTLNLTNISIDSNDAVQVSLADAFAVQNGAGYGTNTNTTMVADLQVRHRYTLTLLATNLSQIYIDMSWVANWTPLGRSGRAGKPKSYKLILNTNETYSSDASVSASGSGSGFGPSTNTWTIELTDDMPANWRLEDGSDDPSFAPGDGFWPQIGPGKSSDPSMGAISWSASLGRLMDGLAAGRITLREAQINPSIFTATNLYFTAGNQIVRDQVNLITLNNDSPVLRQIQSYQCFVDIVSPTTNSTEMRFYYPTNIGPETNEFGWFTNIGGSPFVVWSLVNPAPPGTNQINIIETRNGLARTSQIICNPANPSPTWTLQYGTGSEARIETRGVTIGVSGGVTNRVEVEDIRCVGASTATYHTIETYQRFPWGFELVGTQTPDGNTGNYLTTTNAYYTDPGDPYSYGQLMYTIYPDGYWEARIYDDFPGLYVLRPNESSPGSPVDALNNPSLAVIDMHTTGSSCEFSSQFENPGDINPVLLHDEYYESGTVNDDIVFERNNPADPGLTGTTEDMYDESYGFGVAMHTYHCWDFVSTCYYNYFDPGVYDAASMTFTVGTNDIGQGPDWRQSTVSTYNAELPPSFGGDQPVEITTLGDGHPAPDSGVEIITNKCQRTNQIYSGGSLVQKERYVVTGTTSDGSDPTNEPTFELVDFTAYQNDSLGHVTNIVWVDGTNGISRVVYLADYKGTNSVDGDLKLWEQDVDGVRTDYTYDSLKRVVATIKEGVSGGGSFATQAPITNSSTYDAQNRVLSTRCASSGIVLTTQTAYDEAGRMTQQVSTNGLVTSYSYDLGGRRTTTTLPSGATQTVENYLDRRIKSKTGTGIVNEFHDWEYGALDPNNEAFPPLPGWDPWRGDTAHRIQYGYQGSPRCRIEEIDMGAFLLAVQTPDWSPDDSVLTTYLRGVLVGDARNGALLEQIGHPGGSTTYISYDGMGKTNMFETCGGAYSRDYLTSRKIGSWHGFEKDGGAWFEVETNWVYDVNGSTNCTVTNITRARLNGFTNGNTLSEVTTIDVDSNATVVTTTVAQGSKEVTETTTSTSSTLAAVKIMVNGLLESQSTLSVATPTQFTYDSLGRLIQTTDPLGFTSSKAYNGSGQVASSTDPSGLTTTYSYYGNGSYGAGQVSSMTVGGKSTYCSYTALGNLYRRWGDVPYPEERVYDATYGDLTELHTFRGGSGWNAATWPGNPGTPDVTRWIYQEATGLMTNKTDSAGQAVSYTYWQGLETSRTWARVNGTNSVTRTNFYDSLCEPTGCAYNNGTPPVTITNLDRRGLPTEIDDASGTNELAYDYAGRLISSTWTGGLFNGICVSNHFNPVYGRDAMIASGLSSTLETDYGYDAYGRMNAVSSGGSQVGYGYLPDSDLLERTMFSNASSAVLTTARQWDYGFRLGSIANVVNGATVTSDDYAYDNLNRRTRATLEDGSLWNYSYNNRNELTGAGRFWSDWTPVTGQQYGYGFDNIGNRTSAQSGSLGNLSTVSYTVNGLNEYTGIVTPGSKDILGLAIATNTVTVNGGLADRKVEYFHKNITIANGNGPVWQNVSITAGATTNGGGLVFPGNSQALVYDADGNLTSDGVWSYQWDAENRLITMSMNNIYGIANSNVLQVTFAYDFMNRRISKIVSTNSGSGFVPQFTNYFIYDGWNLIATFGTTGAIEQSFLWGLDLSGTMANAGGVGGLLAIANSGTNYFASYDGNGNITGLINGTDKSTSARYEYSPFGELLRATGPMAKVNPFRFSTKFCDDESGLVYYGYRYYSPAMGRWLGRDHSEEKGGVNLFAFVLNCSLTAYDTLGDMTRRAFMNCEAQIRAVFDDLANYPWYGGASGTGCRFIQSWFGVGKLFDWSHNDLKGEKFDVPGYSQLLDAGEASDYLFGYAAGYAYFKTGNPIYSFGLDGASGWFESIAYYENYKTGGSAQADAGIATACALQYNGELQGEMDALASD